MSFRKILISMWTLTSIMFIGTTVSAPLDIDAVLDREKMKPRGRWDEALVPDTLDLAERVRYSLNTLTRDIEPDKFYSVVNIHGGDVFHHDFKENRWQTYSLTWNLMCKHVRALPMVRTMCGSDLNLDVEYEMMKTLMGQIREDGQMYYPFEQEGAPKDTSYPLVNGITALAFLNWHARDGNDEWLDWVGLLCRGLMEAAIEIEDRAYYPPESGYKPGGVWEFTPRGKPFFDYTPPDEPVFDQQSLEGSIKFEQSQPIRVLAKYYTLRGDEQALETARKLGRFCLKPGMWENTDAEGYPGHEHGAWAGHFHANLTALHGLLELALVDQNEWLKQFLREAYNEAVRRGVLRLGWFPGWTMAEKYRRPSYYGQVTEVCAMSDLVVLAVRMSDAGLGDYWDDVDHIVRNQMTAQQILDVDTMRRAVDGTPDQDDLLARFVGGAGNGRVTCIEPVSAGCCASNGPIGLYYAWHGITRFNDGVATVNLFLNRATPWMDVDSYLPYEGKVILHNKQAHTTLVRIPAWLKLDQVGGFVNGEPVHPAAAGRYLVFQGLKPKDEIRLEFSVSESSSTYTIPSRPYKIFYRGSTVVDIQPREDATRKIPIYQRDHMKATEAPMKKTKRFIADRILPLQ